ncbi:MAG: hypothetical protein KAU10_00150, partial [Dehalococcoidia bacterium]|nr:hypothetical protein [Dehalococcoidia bacterium]
MRPKNAACCLAIALALVACQVLLIASPVAAIDLNPYDYFEFDYCISFSDTEVEAGEEFQLMATAQVKCIKDLPFGADVAEVIGDIIATHQETGETHTLKEAYSLTITDVPDWKGDTYELDESVSLMFPEGCEPGEYEVIGQLVQVTIDGWDVTGLVPESRKSVAAGTITCAESDGDIPDPLPGYLVLDVLGHSYQCEILEDGSLAEPLDLRLVEGKISLRLEQGTICLDRNDNPLDYLSVTRDTSPPTCESGSVLDAYKLRPNGATFDPYLELDLKYDNEDLPEDAEEDELYIGYYDRDADSWVALESQVDSTESIVMTDVEH